MVEPQGLADFWVTTRGWEHSNWLDSFYPDDLPEDWRLSYFANSFPAVLVSRRDCENLDADTIEQWRDAVDENFVFYLECAIADELISAFAGQLGGILADKADNARTFEEVSDISLPNSPESRVFLSTDGEQCFCLYRPAAELTLVELRMDIEAVLHASATVKRCIFCWDSETPRPEYLENARVIAELLGA